MYRICWVTISLSLLWLTIVGSSGAESGLFNAGEIGKGVRSSTVLLESSRSPAIHREYSLVKIARTCRKLELCSSSALVEDQVTGESLVQKQAEAVLPIASITKLMTAMVVIDAKMNLEEFITIEPKDTDTLRHSRSRLPVGTRLQG